MSGPLGRHARIAFVAAVLAVAAGLGPVDGARSYAAGRPHLDSAQGRSHRGDLLGVAAASPTSVWAVGTLIEHWNGHRWKIQRPRTGNCVARLRGVAAVSSASAWAVGQCIHGLGARAIIVHWDGHRWQSQATPRTGSGGYSELDGVTATSASNAWAVGSYQTAVGPRTLIEHWNGHRWKIQPSPHLSPNPDALNGVTAVSASDAWAVGFYKSTSATIRTLIEHWNGHKWKIQASFSPGANGSQLEAVAAVSGSDAWATGYYVNGLTASTLIEHWNGQMWSVQSSENPGTAQNILSGAAESSRSSAWATGFSVSGTTSSTLVEHWDGQTWALQSSPSPGSSPFTNCLCGVTAISSSNAWAVGEYDTGSVLIEHWNGHRWKT